MVLHTNRKTQVKEQHWEPPMYEEEDKEFLATVNQVFFLKH